MGGVKTHTTNKPPTAGERAAVVARGWGGDEAEIDRVFSIPHDIEINISGRKNNSIWKKKIPNTDSFKIFIEEVLNDINSNNQGKWYKNLKETFSDYQKLSKEIYDWRE